MLRAAFVVLAMLFAGIPALASCEKTNHENIDKWMRTTKGPGKLRKALMAADIDAELSAHAAINLIRTGAEAEVFEAIREMSPARRDQVVGKLVPRLWEVARVEGEMSVPSPAQADAKDALFELREKASAELKQTIDNYLTDWYTGGYYEARANLGKFGGSKVIRTLGPAAGDKLMSAANAILAKPITGATRAKVGDELLLGMAASGSADAVKYILDIARLNRGDKTQGPRALSSLYKAYLDPGGLFDPVEPAALVPSINKLAEIAKDSTASPQMANDAVALIRAIGMPHCLPVLVGMITQLHRDAQFRYVGANNALKCGGPQAILDVVDALPDNAEYQHEDLQGAVSGEIAKLSPRDQTLTVVRQLLGKKSKMARWVAMEALFKLASKADIAAISAISGDGTKLAGYWGDQSDVPANERKAEPTLGKRAAEIVAALKAQP
ncbi:MAG: hypothetical protein KBG15_17630 [Kofleriaceae bacterium]|nr:hypothetical protein [Kofleriaceae bacterium]